MIGVALQKWSLAQLHQRVKDSLKNAEGIDDQKAFDQLLSLLRYVSGDYSDQSTFTAIRKVLGSPKRPTHYLAIPPLPLNQSSGGLEPRSGRRGTRHCRKAIGMTP